MENLPPLSSSLSCRSQEACIPAKVGEGPKESSGPSQADQNGHGIVNSGPHYTSQTMGSGRHHPDIWNGWNQTLLITAQSACLAWWVNFTPDNYVGSFGTGLIGRTYLLRNKQARAPNPPIKMQKSLTLINPLCSGIRICLQVVHLLVLLLVHIIVSKLVNSFVTS